jgi:hypothetical protein
MKLNKHAWALWAIALAVTLALMIAISFARTASWWVSAVCTVVMFALCAYTFYLAFHKDNTLESKLLGWPIFKVGYTALIVQLIVGTMIMSLAAFCPVWVAIIAEVIVFGMTAGALTVRDAARAVVTQSEQAAEDKTVPWKAIRERVIDIANATGHPELKKLAEEIRYADPMPTSMDSEIVDMLATLSSYADAENIKKAYQLVEKRKLLAKEEK